MARGLGRFLRRNTIALLALFLALGGTSYAAATAINGKSIKPNSIPKNRLTKTAIKQLKGNRGPTGLQGIQGPAGPVQLRYLTSPLFSNPHGEQNFGFVSCPAGEYVTGGGGVGGSAIVGEDINASYGFKSSTTLPAPDSWGVWMDNQTALDQNFTVYAICATPSSVISAGPAHQGRTIKAGG